MQVRIKLMGALRSKLPAGSQGGSALVDLERGGVTVADVLAKLGIGAQQIHLVMVNGEQETERQRPLRENDELVVFPPVAGGNETAASH